MAATTAFAVASKVHGQQSDWALQLGYFENRDNAERYVEELTRAGFDIQMLTSGDKNNQRYRIIGGWADQPEDFETLQNRVEDATGSRGYILPSAHIESSPVEPNESLLVFDPPRARYLLAQAGITQTMGGESVASGAKPRFDPDVFRTPQEEIDSIPGFTAAGMQIIPTLGLTLGYDDNLTRSDGDEIDSVFYVISPAIRVELPSDRSILALTAAVDIFRYEDSPIDDREPWYVRADWAWDPSTRQDFNLFGQYSEGTNPRGTGRRQGDSGLLPIPPDEWKRTDFGGKWRYGAIGSRGRLELRAGAVALKYTNNREDTYLLDRSWWFGGGTFYWRVAPKTSVLADVQYSDIDYDFADSDNEETSWMLGVTWEATARTSGTLRYGNQKKKFDNPELADYSGPTWVAAVSWRPRTYSLLTLTGTRRTLEPDGNADFVVRQDITLAWTHDWTTRFGTVVDVGWGEDDYRPDVRTDDLFYWSIGARHMLNPHLRLGASIQRYERTSDIDEFDFNRTIYMLTLEASF